MRNFQGELYSETHKLSGLLEELRQELSPSSRSLPKVRLRLRAVDRILRYWLGAGETQAPVSLKTALEDWAATLTKALEASKTPIEVGLWAERCESVYFSEEYIGSIKKVMAEYAFACAKFSLETLSERALRGKSPRAEIRVEAETGPDVHKITIRFDGNGLLPPMEKSFSQELRKMRIWCEFESVPTESSQLKFMIPAEQICLKVVEVETGGNRYCIPTSAIGSAKPARSAALLEPDGIFVVKGFVRVEEWAPTESGDQNLDKKWVVEIRSAFSTRRFCFDSIGASETIFLAPLPKRMQESEVFLGGAIVPRTASASQQPLQLVLDPDFLVGGALEVK